MAEATATDTQDQTEETQGASTAEVSEAELPEAADNGDRTGGGQIDILLCGTRRQRPWEKSALPAPSRL